MQSIQWSDSRRRWSRNDLPVKIMECRTWSHHGKSRRFSTIINLISMFVCKLWNNVNGNGNNTIPLGESLVGSNQVIKWIWYRMEFQKNTKNQKTSKISPNSNLDSIHYWCESIPIKGLLIKSSTEEMMKNSKIIKQKNSIYSHFIWFHIIWQRIEVIDHPESLIIL